MTTKRKKEEEKGLKNQESDQTDVITAQFECVSLVCEETLSCIPYGGSIFVELEWDRHEYAGQQKPCTIVPFYHNLVLKVQVPLAINNASTDCYQQHETVHELCEFDTMYT